MAAINVAQMAAVAAGAAFSCTRRDGERERDEPREGVNVFDGVRDDVGERGAPGEDVADFDGARV